jgi:hypothetical protein
MSAVCSHCPGYSVVGAGEATAAPVRVGVERLHQPVQLGLAGVGRAHLEPSAPHVVWKHLSEKWRSTTRKLVVALAAGAIGRGVGAAPAAAEPTPRSCIGEVVSSSVQPSAFGPGRRAVATMFFGDYPTAVQDAQRALQDFCAS